MALLRSSCSDHPNGKELKYGITIHNRSTVGIIR
jgi:hypothetical protein